MDSLLKVMNINSYTFENNNKLKIENYLFIGAGLSTVIMSFLLTTYYNVIMSWALFYLVYSFSPSLPWEVNIINLRSTWDHSLDFSIN